MPAKIEDNFETIAEEYANKTNLDLNRVSFLSNGRIIKMDDIINKIMNKLDVQKNRMNVMVISIENTINTGINNIYKGIEQLNIESKEQINEILCP